MTKARGKGRRPAGNRDRAEAGKQGHRERHDSVRSVAAAVLTDLQKQQGSLATLLPSALERVPDADRALLQELTYGVSRWYYSLQAVLETRLEKPLRNKDLDVYSLLLVGVYQLDYMRIATHAAINLSVEAAQELRKPWARGLVNGLLRGHQRDKEQQAQVAEQSDQARYAHPAWMIEQLQNDWPDAWRDVLEAGNQRPPMVLRINQAQTGYDEYSHLLKEEGIEHQPVCGVISAIQLYESCAVQALPGFATGLVSVQDASAQLACQLLLPELQKASSQTTILDACAAPGGKTCHLLEASAATVVAMDISETRLARVGENLERLGFEARATLVAADAAAGGADSFPGDEEYDIVLVDAPCSGSGVIRRQPDIKLLRKPDDLHDLAIRQRNMVDSLWSSVKPGGKLMYVTCSVFRQENVEVMKAFLAGHQDAVEISLQDRCSNSGLLFADFAIDDAQAQASGKELTKYPGTQVLTGVNAMDGFYYCLVEKSQAQNVA